MGETAEPSSMPPRPSSNKPYGTQILERLLNKPLSYKTHQATVLIITFLSYAAYHAARKTTSIVKSVLDPKSSSKLSAGWPPFDGDGGTALLGEIDLAFLAFYSFGMFFSGHIADRTDLRIFLTAGMLGTGAFTSLFGVGYWGGIHNFGYYIAVQMLAGLFQSTGWPTVVAVVGNWCGKRKRGLVMGVWNAHTSIGNISGSLIAAAMLRFGWGWSFVVPGLVIGFVGLVVFLFLPVSPVSVGVGEKVDDDGVLEPLVRCEEGEEWDGEAVGFMEAWRIPGVAPFALCLFFAKLVAYTFLYWLPFYISNTAIDGKYLSTEMAGNLSTLFDVGGVAGGILAGHISDRLDARAITAASFMYCAIPALYLYRIYGSVSLTANISLMLLTGVFVNGPYALITTAVSADLGTHSSLRGNSRALATVTAIIDGTGSIGAAIGPLLTGYISARSWGAVFTMLMVAAFVSGLMLTRLVAAEVGVKIRESRNEGGSLGDVGV